MPAQPPRGRSELPSPTDAVVQTLSFIGIGWMLIIVASIALVAIGCGWSPFGGRAPRD